MNTMFKVKVHKCTWYQNTLGQKSTLGFVGTSTDMWPHVLDSPVQTGAELSADHHLVVGWIRWRGGLLGSGEPQTPLGSPGELETSGGVVEPLMQIPP